MDKLGQTTGVSAYGRHNQKRDGSHKNRKSVYYIDTDISALKDKVKPGDTIKARIVLDLGENKYVLRFYGYNYIMESHIKFNRFDEVTLDVEATDPRLKLKIRKPEKKRTHGGHMDIRV
ncbi:MAG TPA: hypothetical protein ENJ10_10485 [Caldithrix abyssi]|uniref:Uncharacterized protein n=1 Tax=Caldithrix abyssi TaxID=187145 RepID=A0A7V1LN53_CALAY|nr:hypothetical protein [Caldithrix abyssi]